MEKSESFSAVVKLKPKHLWYFYRINHFNHQSLRRKLQQIHFQLQLIVSNNMWIYTRMYSLLAHIQGFSPKWLQQSTDSQCNLKDDRKLE